MGFSRKEYWSGLPFPSTWGNHEINPENKWPQGRGGESANQGFPVTNTSSREGHYCQGLPGGSGCLPKNQCDAHGPVALETNRRSKKPFPLALAENRGVGVQEGPLPTSKVISCSASLDPVPPEAAAAALRARAPLRGTSSAGYKVYLSSARQTTGAHEDRRMVRLP